MLQLFSGNGGLRGNIIINSGDFILRQVPESSALAKLAVGIAGSLAKRKQAAFSKAKV
ncbi:hypothetical protein [Nostoc sp.]|uniref:hypothetical protein n=1 Tax=Nostoc sp. TaxID=1180 RepID=UPI002FF5C119